MKPLQSDPKEQPRRAGRVSPAASRFLGCLKIKSRARWVTALAFLALAGGGGALSGVPAYAQTGRTVRIGNATGTTGLTVSLPVELVSQGNENALGFSLNFDPTLLSNPQVANGSDIGGASVNSNTSLAAQGRLGFALALPAGQSYTAGTKQLIVITLTILATPPAGTTPVTFVDQPIKGEVVSPTVEDLTAGTTFTPGTLTINRGLTSVSAASFRQEALAPESIGAAFGTNLATSTASATTIPLPTELAGTTLKIRRNEAGATEQPVSLFFASPTQLNYLVPPMTASGQYILTATNGSNVTTLGPIQVAAVAPGIFTANNNGQGVPAAVAVRARGGAAVSTEPVFQAGATGFVPLPIDLGPETDTVFLVLFGTGFRFFSAISAVTASVGGTNATVEFAGPVSGFVGLDQANIRLPRSLIGRAEVDVTLTVDGKASNPVRINIQ